jgi:hypothetical protein
MDATPTRPRSRVLVAVALWAGFALLVALFVATNPGRRTVTPTYRIAAAAWFDGERLYNEGDEIGGFLYFPQAALVYVPFTALPEAAGEILWRVCGLALFATGIWRLAGLIDTLDQGRLFVLFTLLCIPATVSSARNGQMNLHLAGLMLHATADLAARVWWRAALSLVAGLALKPHAIVPLLLVAAVYPRTRTWLATMIAVVAALPFLLQRPGYVAGQYLAAVERIVFATMPVTDTWSDLRGLLIRLNVDLSNRRLIILRLAAALPTLVLALRARRHGPAWSAIYVFALGAVYLMLFNARNESNSYVILAPAVAATFAAAASRRHTIAAWALAVFAVALGCEDYGRTVFLLTDLWLKPLLTIAFGIYLVRLISTPAADVGVTRGARLA